MSDASRLGLVVAIALALSATSQAGQILYGITDDDNLITINTATGAGTLIGAITLGGDPIDIAPVGLASFGGNLYAYDSNDNVLQQLDPATADIISTINLGIGFSIGNGNMTFRGDGTGFMASTLDDTGSFGDGGTLLTFGTSANSANVVDTSGLPSGFGLYDGLSFIGNTLYALSQFGDTLSTLDTTTGAATQIGTGTGITTTDPNTGFPLYGFGGLAYGPDDGVLYGDLADFGSVSNLYTFDPSTGLGTLVGAIGIDQVDGLAFLTTPNAVPEPSTFALLGGVLLMAGAFRKRFGI